MLFGVDAFVGIGVEQLNCVKAYCMISLLLYNDVFIRF